jgi:cytochrome c553
MAYKNTVSISLILLLGMTARPAPAQADLEQGKVLAYTCMGCHGIEGYRNAYPSFHVPKLGGQKSAYIETALRAYRSGDRHHPTMQAQGASLADQEIKDIAAYLASSGESQDQLVANDVAGSAAAALCVTCHGAEGASVVPTPPALAGQHEDYLARALQQYKNGERSGNVMSAFAAGLSDADIKMLARLYASQDGLHTLSD